METLLILLLCQQSGKAAFSSWHLRMDSDVILFFLFNLGRGLRFPFLSYSRHLSKSLLSPQPTFVGVISFSFLPTLIFPSQTLTTKMQCVFLSQILVFTAIYLNLSFKLSFFGRELSFGKKEEKSLSYFFAVI